jgi:transcriptional regulator with XRE-family HTH domain
MGVISGYVFRVIREQMGQTQEAVSERLRVSVDTIAGWESGRRPLTRWTRSVLVEMIVAGSARLSGQGCGRPCR